MKSAFFAINKPRGISSAAVVNKVKHLFKAAGEKVKVGNMGTLDVDASGVLVIALNKATRLFDYFAKMSKTYVTTIKFGVETNTLDSTGEITKTSNILPTKEQILEAIKKLEGEYLQTPPNYSAKRVNGERAYKLMRQGENGELELKPKLVKIYGIELLEQIADDEWKFEITCGTGTYIRAIARDIAAYNTTYGITTSIIRTKSGIFNLNNALDFEKIDLNLIKQNALNVNDVLPYKVIELTKQGSVDLLNGKYLNAFLSNGHYFISVDGEVTMLAKCENGKLKIEINLMEN